MQVSPELKYARAATTTQGAMAAAVAGCKSKDFTDLLCRGSHGAWRHAGPLSDSRRRSGRSAHPDGRGRCHLCRQSTGQAGQAAHSASAGSSDAPAAEQRRASALQCRVGACSTKLPVMCALGVELSGSFCRQSTSLQHASYPHRSVEGGGRGRCGRRLSRHSGGGRCSPAKLAMARPGRLQQLPHLWEVHPTAQPSVSQVGSLQHT